MSTGVKGAAWCAHTAAAKLRWAAGRIAAQARASGEERHRRQAARLAMLAKAIADNAPACGCRGDVVHLPARRDPSS